MPRRAAPWRFVVVVALLAIVSAGFAALCYAHGWTLYYGDAQAHLDNARRIIDSRTPGYYQIGTAWLPLPQVLMLPLVWNMRLWQTGIAGVVPSAICFVLAGSFLWLSARRAFQNEAAAWGALLVFALNPNLLYLQSTPMTEPMFFGALMAVLYFTLRYAEEQSRGALICAAFASLAASLTRYEGWFLIPFTAGYVLLVSRERRIQRAFLFGIIASAGPIWWLAHNGWVYGNALEWLNGPGSPKGIEGAHKHPGDHDWGLAGLYFRTAARDVIGAAPFVIAGLGLVGVMWRRAFWPCALLLLPPVFYIWSIHSGSIPIHVPELWPHSYYNTRYGLAALPLLAFCAGGLVLCAPKFRPAAALVVALAAAVPWLISPKPGAWLCWKESQVNSVDRRAWTAEAAAFLAREYRGGGILASSGDVTGIFCRAGIPLRDTLNDGNYPEWSLAVDAPTPLLNEQWAVAQAGDTVSRTVARSRRYVLWRRIVAGSSPAIEIWRRR